LTRRRVRTPAPVENEGDLVKVLVVFARWRKCCCCSRSLLFVDALCRTDADVECPTCQAVREGLALRLRPSNSHQMSLPDRVALHVKALLFIANDNGEARP
jgi:hypothetical protein